jgi:Family of unknown function (DUF6491)
MRCVFVTFLAFLAGACASAKKAPFDAGSDARVGREVAKACFRDAGRRHGGGYLRVGDYDAYVTGLAGRQFLLVFSGGCSDLRPGGGFAIFQNYGDDCRRRGELVRTASAGLGVSGACTIKNIYEWDRREAEDDAALND